MTRKDECCYRTVHVVDDDDALRDSLVWLIEGAGYAVNAYPDAESFLDALSVIEPGCIVSDIRMPGLSGLQLFDALKARDVPFPVIFLTGHGDVPMATGALRAGAIDFLEKPVDEMVLLARIEEALARLAAECSERAARRTPLWRHANGKCSIASFRVISTNRSQTNSQFRSKRSRSIERASWKRWGVGKWPNWLRSGRTISNPAVEEPSGGRRRFARSKTNGADLHLRSILCRSAM